MNTPKGPSWLFPLTLTLLLLASAGPAETKAQATAITSSARIPIEFFDANSCTGDQIAIDGSSHMLFHANGSPGGHSNAKLQINFALQGVSAASGVKYVVNEAVTTTTQSSVDGAFVFHTVGRLNVVSQGGADNLVVRTEIHSTFNAGGELTSSRFVFTAECRG